MVSQFNKRVLRTAVPAILLAIFIFVTLMLLINYTEAAYLVVVLWIVVPVVCVQLYRKIRNWLKAKGKSEGAQ